MQAECHELCPQIAALSAFLGLPGPPTALLKSRQVPKTWQAGSSCDAQLGNAQNPHFVLERRSARPEEARRLRLVAARRAKRVATSPRSYALTRSFNEHSVVARARLRRVRRRLGERRQLGEIGDADPLAAGEDRRALEHVLELAHVARPVVGLELGERVVVELLRRGAEAAPPACAGTPTASERDVFSRVAERRDRGSERR